MDILRKTAYGKSTVAQQRNRVVDHQKIDLFPKTTSSCIYYFPGKSVERTSSLQSERNKTQIQIKRKKKNKSQSSRLFPLTVCSQQKQIWFHGFVWRLQHFGTDKNSHIWTIWLWSNVCFKREKNVKLQESDRRPEPKDFSACEAHQEPFLALLSSQHVSW